MKPSHAAIGVLLALSWTVPAWAEVADKEASLSDIWIYAAVGVALSLIAGVWRLWAGGIVWAISVFAAYGSVAEWRDPFVGPAIEQEISRNYGWHACGALAMSLIIPLAAFLWQRHMRRR